MFNSTPFHRSDHAIPSSGLAILQADLRQKQHEARIIYWDFHLGHIMEPYFNKIHDLTHITNYERFASLPYLYILNRQEGDQKRLNRLEHLLSLLIPDQYLSNGRDALTDFFNKAEKKIYKAVDRIVLEKFEDWGIWDLGQTDFFGCTCKLNQYVSAEVITQRVLHHAPHIPTGLGGFGTRAQAEAVMAVCPSQKFAIWGEAEDPLGKLLIVLKDETEDFGSVPGLVYRCKNGSLKVSEQEDRQYLPFDKSYPIPRYDDYIQQAQTAKFPVNTKIFLINTIRGCPWNQCKFCIANHGYCYRERPPEHIPEEIKQIREKYDGDSFIFADTDIRGSDPTRFDHMLDLLWRDAIKNKSKLAFRADLIPRNLTESSLRKLARIGFLSIEIGFESLSDSLMKDKMGKSHDVATNIQFVKHANENGIKTLNVVLIRGVPGETEEEVYEIMRNLFFIRFFKNTDPPEIRHLIYHYETPLGNSLSLKEREREDMIIPGAYFFSKSPDDPDLRFALFPRYRAWHPNEHAWCAVEKLLEFLQENTFSYRVSIDDTTGTGVYEEFQNESRFRREPLTTLEVETLILSHEITSIMQLHSQIKDSLEDLFAVVNALKLKRLVYHNRNFTRIISPLNKHKFIKE